MRILLTTDVVGGVWDHATTLQRRLTERGHCVLLAVLGQPSCERLDGVTAGADWVARPFRLEWEEGGLEAVEPAARWIDELAERMDADVVHLNQLTYAHRIRRPTLTVVHSDTWSWFSEVRGRLPGDDARWNAYRAAVARGLRASSLVVAPSRYQARLATRHYAPVDRVVRNGIDTHPAGPLDEAVEPDWPTHGPVLVTAGRAWDPAKGIAVIDEALGLTAEAWTGYLAGDLSGPGRACFHPERLRALGHLPRPALGRLFARSGVYVAASLYEPFGLAPLEAASAGCALVLSDIGSFRELWGSHALYFQPGNPSALAAALDRLNADPALALDLGARARARARARFDDRKMAARYARLYAALLRRRTRFGTSDPARRWPHAEEGSRRTAGRWHGSGAVVRDLPHPPERSPGR